MPQKKKLQVFVSSTYTDLKEERQAAVEAILTAGHIPAGMELFAAGDESQMSVIKRWIDESDVYLLILGGRYGSLEPKSQKSYIHLEYDYAVERNKPLFAVVIEAPHLEEKVKAFGSQVIETDNPQKLKEFRAEVLSRMVRFWRDPRDIKLAILETMSDFSRREDLVGWIPGSAAVDTGAVAEELARLAKDNATLREQVAKSSTSQQTFSGLTFEQMYKVLLDEEVSTAGLNEIRVKLLEGVSEAFGDSKIGLVHLFWILGRNHLGDSRIDLKATDTRVADMRKAVGYGLVDEGMLASGTFRFIMNEVGRQFILRLKIERDTLKAERLFHEAQLGKH